jgi:creatinine amidohydrolase
MIYRLEELFPHELEAQLKSRPVLVQPFGTIEWHSFHLPLGLDGIVAKHLCEAIAEKCEAVLAPVSYFSVGGVPYPYTFKFTGEVLEPLYVSLFQHYAEMGFKVVVAFTGHFGLEHTLVLKRAALTAMTQTPITVLPLTEYDLTTEFYKGDHAGIGETSLLMHYRNDLVRLDAVASDIELDGVLGGDPRGKATETFGVKIADTIIVKCKTLTDRFLQGSALERAKYIEALALGVRVLARTVTARAEQPKSFVPSVTTTAYLAYCQELFSGNYARAKQWAEQKLTDLSA